MLLESQLLIPQVGVERRDEAKAALPSDLFDDGGVANSFRASAAIMVAFCSTDI